MGRKPPRQEGETRLYRRWVDKGATGSPMLIQGGALALEVWAKDGKGEERNGSKRGGEDRLYTRWNRS
jgi:hypothetical protein